ncbi:MAG: hypothetical protein ABSH34_30405 [Verrucomicrobiota bacterium]|jgi:hypothetical protein
MNHQSSCKQAVRAAAWAAVLLLGPGTRALAGADLPPVWHWSNPTPHGADIFALARSQGTYVQVGEQGQIFTSYDLASTNQVWMPQQSYTTASLQAATFFGGRCVIVGEAGTVLFSDDLSSFYLVDLDTTNWLESVAVSTNLVVAVGDNGAIYTSAEGVSWTNVSTGFSKWLAGVAYGHNHFVAVGESGFIATSTDGSVWKTVNSGTTKNLNWVAWQGNQFMAVGDDGVTLTSTTGGKWQTITTGATNFLYTVSGSTNAWLVGGDSELWVKASSSWSDQLSLALASPAPNWTYYASAWSTNTTNAFVVCGSSGMTAIGARTNGAVSWRTPSQPVRSWLWQTARMPDYYLAVGNYGTILSSPDGYAWSVELAPLSLSNSVLLGVGGSTNLQLAVGTQGTVLWATNAYLWSLLTVPTTNDLEGVFFDGTQFILCGDNGTILTSTNLTTWTEASTPTAAFLTSITLFPDRMVVVGDKGTILTSTNRIDWTLTTPLTTNWLSQVGCLNGALVAVGNNGTILTSYDATNWVARDSGATNWLNAVDYLAGTWFVAGNQGTVLGSPDLTNWVVFPTLTSKSLYGLAHNQGQLITVGAEGVILRSQIVAPSTPVNIPSYAQSSGQTLFLFTGQLDQQFFLYSSTDLSTWTQGPLLEFQDDSGTLLYLQDAQTNPPPCQFYRTQAVQ